MDTLDFGTAFAALTGNPPFPWQRALYERFISDRKDNIPASCNLPTGLGKTSVIAVWLIALANYPTKMPRRLVYVVNRRTVVDQTTDEVEKIRDNILNSPQVELGLMGLSAPRPVPKVPYAADALLAISTLRGQFADNREWSADPSRPAVICGTVDMIGSRLLFSGYGCGFKTRPLHAGFLGQDALLVHDEAHLEPAFQKLLLAIEDEQKRCKDFCPLRVMELTATSRAGGEAFELTPKDYDDKTVKQRIGATKKLHLHAQEKKTTDDILKWVEALPPAPVQKENAVLIFVRQVKDVEDIVKKLPKGQTQQLTGTLRGLERDRLATEDAIFARFLPESNRPKGVEPTTGTVYLVCTSAGEVGVNISADHLVCDLSTFESMAQRFGRVNRFGLRDDTEVHVVYPKEFDEKDALYAPLNLTLGLLELLNGNASPSALTALRERAIAEGSNTEPPSSDRVKALRDYVNANEGKDPRLGGFAPQPTILPPSDILFDAWALTSIRGKLPGRPPVEKYLHGITSWEPPETHVAWREEVWELRLKFDSEEERKSSDVAERKRLAKFAEDLLEDYPLKPHEQLRDRTDRVFKHLTTIAARNPTDYAWLVDDQGSVEVFTLKELADKDKKDRLDGRTVLLPPEVGGLRDGLLDGGAPTTTDLDVADEWYADTQKTVRRRRVWDGEADPDGMREVRRIEFPASEDDDDAATRSWRWFVRPLSADDDGSKSAQVPITWQHHTDDVVANSLRIASALFATDSDFRKVFEIAARCHDLGKQREVWQRSIGNPTPKIWYAKSGKDPKTNRLWRPVELTDYRHEFGSLIDATKHEDVMNLDAESKAFVLHVIATHHGRGRPHFPADEVFDPERSDDAAKTVAREVPQRFARLQRKYGRWGLAYLESLLRAADYAASANPSEFVKEGE